MEVKTCNVCNEEKSFDDFQNLTKSKDGKNYRCKVCDYATRKRYLANKDPVERKRMHRSHFLKRVYNITIEDYEAMLGKQGGVCAICGGTETKSSQQENFSVDHCHTTGVIRGLLCNNCNRGLGLLGDTIESLTKALEYLK